MPHSACSSRRPRVPLQTWFSTSWQPGTSIQGFDLGPTALLMAHSDPFSQHTEVKPLQYVPGPCPGRDRVPFSWHATEGTALLHCLRTPRGVIACVKGSLSSHATCVLPPPGLRARATHHARIRSSAFCWRARPAAAPLREAAAGAPRAPALEGSRRRALARIRRPRRAGSVGCAAGWPREGRRRRDTAQTNATA